MMSSAVGTRSLFAALCLLIGMPLPSRAQAPDAPLTDAYLDARAGELHLAARRNWSEIDESVLRYSARVQQRIAAMIRAPLKDRVLYRNESAVRVFWDRDHDTFVQVLGANAQYPGRDYADLDGYLDDLTIESAFDPGSDRLTFFGNDDDDPSDVDREQDFWLAHPLAPGADSLYRFETGDSLALSFPDGRRLNTVELLVIPRRLDVHLLTGALWIEPETGALVRAVYRLSDQFNAMRDVPDLQEEDDAGEFDLVPGIFKPWTFDLRIVAIDYSLWDFRVWLPRSMRVEGQARAGILKFPVEFDLAYRIENVVLEDDLGTELYETAVLEERHFESRADAMEFLAQLMSEEEGLEFRPLTEVSDESRGSADRFLVPRDPEAIRTSDQLPPPIWEDAAGFATEADLESMFGSLADLPLPEVEGIPWAANWGLQRPDLVRYNRVEGPALGARFEARFGSFVGPIDFRATGFFGFADLEPKARVDFNRTSLRREWQLGAYRDIRAMMPRGRHLELGNSLNALLFGRDDGEYYLATGVDLRLRRPETERQAWSVRGWAERQDPMGNKSRFAVFHAFDGDWDFRRNLQAEPIEEVGGALELTPFWGGDPLLPQFGMELEVAGGVYRAVDPDTAAPDTEGDWVRTRAILRSAFPLASGRWRIGLEAGAGHAWGDLPVQRAFLLGGPQNLRGYDPTTVLGSTFGRGRVEVARVWPGTTGVVFTDAGWAGEYDLYDSGDILYSVGVGASILDGLIRLDLSRGLAGPSGLRRTRLDLYLDAIL